MFPIAWLFGLILLAISSPTASAEPVNLDSSSVTLSFAARVNASGYVNVAEADRARIAYLRSSAKGRPTLNQRDGISFSLQNTAVTYSASIGIGSPPTPCEYAATSWIFLIK